MRSDTLIDSKDYELIDTVTGFMRAFFDAAQAHVDSNPSLKAAMAKPEFKSFQLARLYSDIANIKCEQTAEFMEGFSNSSFTADQLQQIDAGCALAEAQKYDAYIGIVERFIPRGMLAEMLPQAVVERPGVFAKTMERYGMPRTANAVLYKWALTQG